MTATFGRRTEPEDPPPPEPQDRTIDYGKVALVFIAFGLLGLLTALILNASAENVFSSKVWPEAQTADAAARKDDDPAEPGEKYPARRYATIGPVVVKKANQVFEVEVDATLPVDSWNFIETELLDADKEYLLSFGKELWHETGYDDGGHWDEADRSYQMKLTIPQPGTYYLNLKTQGDKTPETIYVTIVRTLGSSIPHLVFGLLTLVIGLGLNEYVNRTVIRLLGRFK